jgi:nicotinate-nucleotide adenylyltransferase
LGLSVIPTVSVEAGGAAEHCLPLVHRVGIFGGAFDPPHMGHHALAQSALEQLGLDVLHILPTGQAWHKSRSLTPAMHRVAMCELAFDDLPKVHIDTREIERQGASYTVDTVLELSEEYPGVALYLIIGADQLLAFKHWVRWPAILDLATLAVAQRSTQDPTRLAPAKDAPADLSSVDVPFVALKMPLFNVSATAIRARLSSVNRGDADLDHLLSADVASYISTHSLYQDPK